MKTLAIGAAACALTVAVAGPAFAAGQKVTVGTTSTNGTHAITGASTGTTVISVQRTDGTNLTFDCGGFSVPSSPTSTVRSGTGVTALFALNRVNFSGCVDPVETTGVSSGTWTFANKGAVTTARTDVVKGSLTNVNMRINSFFCSFTVSGTAKATFSEKTQTIKVAQPQVATGGITVSAIDGCARQLANGAKVSVNGSVKINSPKGLINVKPS